MATIEAPENLKELPLSFINQSITLATSGFGVVVALAWNEFIQSVITTYIEPYLGKSSGLVSQGIYALAITFLAVMITMQLVRVQRILSAFHKEPGPSLSRKK